MSRVEDVKTPVKIALSRCHGSSPPRGCVCLFIAPARISTFRFLLSALLLATPIYSYLHQNTEHEVRIVPVSPDFCFQISAFCFVSWSCHPPFFFLLSPGQPSGPWSCSSQVGFLLSTFYFLLCLGPLVFWSLGPSVRGPWSVVLKSLSRCV